MKAGSLSITIVLGVFLIGSAGIAAAGGPELWSDAPRHARQVEKKQVEKKAGTSLPVMLPGDYLEYLENEKGIETGSLTAPGVAPTVVSGPSTPVEIPDGG